MTSVSSSGRIRKPSKRAGSPGGGITPASKKKRPATPQASGTPGIVDVESGSSNVPSPAPSDTGNEVAPVPKKVYIFKDPNFVHSLKGSVGNKKSRTTWKTLKQILAADRALPWKPDDATYSNIEAPPSFKPAKKYSDLSGLNANYTDPHTKIRYANTEEFSRIRMLPSDIVTGYLSLRKANVPVP